MDLVERALRILLFVGVLLAFSVGTAHAAGPGIPAGVTAIALDGGAEVAWQPVVGASAYVVYRNGAAVTPPAGVTATSFTDGGLTDGTSYAYVVHAVAGGVESPDSTTVQVTPVARTCSSSNIRSTISIAKYQTCSPTFAKAGPRRK